MNMNPNAKPLIFTNLPFEIEVIILGYYREIRANIWNETLRMFSSKKLARELYRQSEHQTGGLGICESCNGLSYKREIFRLYNQYLPEYDDPITDEMIEEEFNRSQGHGIINMGILLNDSIDERILAISYASLHDVIERLDNHLSLDNPTVMDGYDEEITSLWKVMTIDRKENLIRNYFQTIKQDYLKNYGIVNSGNISMRLHESAYRVLRFAFINNSKQFKLL